MTNNVLGEKMSEKIVSIVGLVIFGIPTGVWGGISGIFIGSFINVLTGQTNSSKMWILTLTTVLITAAFGFCLGGLFGYWITPIIWQLLLKICTFIYNLFL